MNPTTYTRMLPCRLTQDERLERAGSAQRCTMEATRLDVALKAHAKSVKAEAQHQLDQAARALAAATSGQELREVECRDEPHGADLLVVTVRQDTGECIDTRPMSDAERQLVIAQTKRDGEADERDAKARVLEAVRKAYAAGHALSGKRQVAAALKMGKAVAAAAVQELLEEGRIVGTSAGYRAADQAEPKAEDDADTEGDASDEEG